MKITQNIANFALAIAVAFTSQSSLALDAENYSQARFEQLQSENALILVDIYATWCPTCAKQGKILEAYLEQNPESELKVLRVDFDDQKEVVKKFRAPRQSTLYLYRGSDQLWFSVAEKRKKVVFEAISKADNVK